MVGMLLAVAFLVFFMYLLFQSTFGTTDTSDSKYQQGVDAIEDAEEVKRILEQRKP